MCEKVIFFGKGKLFDLIKSLKINKDIYVIDNDYNKLIKKISKDVCICLVMDGFQEKVLEEFENCIPLYCEYVSVFGIFNNIFIGNRRKKNDEGCLECIVDRYIMTRKDRQELFEIKKYLQDKSDALAVSNLTKSLGKLIINIVYQRRYGKLEVSIINSENLSYKTSSFLPISTCKRCGRLIEDSKEITLKEFTDALSNENIKYRKYDMRYFKNILTDMYVDNNFGIFNFLLDDVETSYSVSVANLPIKNGKDEVGVGRTNSYETSKSVAILEGLERYSGMESRYKKTVISEAYDKLKSKALDPITLGLHSEKQYEQPGFIFKKYKSDKKINWVWGYSLSNKECILVPESIGYYGINIRDYSENRFVYEISNGCALGGSLLEACMSGMLEVIERDAFLITWYTKIPLPILDISKIENKEIKLMISRFQYNFSYQIHIFDMTLDTGVPTVLALAKNMNEDNRMNIMCAAGCNMQYEKAIEGALHELCGIIPALNKKFKKRYSELKEMVKNFMLVQTMEDHSLLYGLKEMESEFDFLLKPTKRIKTYSDDVINYSGVLIDDFNSVIERLRRLNLEVIAVNQTAKELKYSGVHCAKVIIPGMLPMTFGHKYKRINNLDRLFIVPKKLNHDIKNINEIKNGNVSPHPFP